MSALRAVAAVLLASAFAAPASAESVRLRTGAVLTVQAPLGSQGPWTPSALGGAGLRYAVADPTGKNVSGTIPGTGNAIVSAGLSVAEDAVGNAYVVFVRPESGTTTLAFSAWNGLSWSQPQRLTTPAGVNDQPVLSFTTSGEALLAWRSRTAREAVLVRHFALAPTGEVVSYAFVEIADPRGLTLAIPGRLGLRDGLAHAVPEAGRRALDLFLADQAAGALGLVRIELEAVEQTGGFNAPPVPVEIVTQMRTDSTGGQAGGVIGRRPATGDVQLAPYHLDLGVGVAYYWFDDATVSLVPFKDGVAGQLVTFTNPGNDAVVHAQAYHAARAALHGERRAVGARDIVRRGR